jgi:hypothetical protein
MHPPLLGQTETNDQVPLTNSRHLKQLTQLVLMPSPCQAIWPYPPWTSDVSNCYCDGAWKPPTSRPWYLEQARWHYIIISSNTNTDASVSNVTSCGWQTNLSVAEVPSWNDYLLGSTTKVHGTLPWTTSHIPALPIILYYEDPKMIHCYIETEMVIAVGVLSVLSV